MKLRSRIWFRINICLFFFFSQTESVILQVIFGGISLGAETKMSVYSEISWRDVQNFVLMFLKLESVTTKKSATRISPQTVLPADITNGESRSELQPPWAIG